MDITKCAGQAGDGTQVCSSRENCLRYVAPISHWQSWADFWKAGDKCQEYLSLKHDKK
jgi:hypothetical protein